MREGFYNGKDTDVRQKWYAILMACKLFRNYFIQAFSTVFSVGGPAAVRDMSGGRDYDSMIPRMGSGWNCVRIANTNRRSSRSRERGSVLAAQVITTDFCIIKCLSLSLSIHNLTWGNYAILRVLGSGVYMIRMAQEARSWEWTKDWLGMAWWRKVWQWFWTCKMNKTGPRTDPCGTPKQRETGFK